MHEELHRLLQSTSKQGGQHIAIAAPRGHAKSTLITLMFVLWIACTERERFILLISDTKEKAAGFLRDIKQELENNQKLRQDFPKACELPGKRAAPRRWRENELEMRNGVLIAAAGAGQSLRGKRFKSARPGLIILDDIESNENTATAELREKMEDWLNRVVMNAGDKNTNIIMVGTILHFGSLLAKLTDDKKNGAWQGLIYRAVEQWSPRDDLWKHWSQLFHGHESYQELIGCNAAQRFFEDNQTDMLQDTQVLWPEKEDYHYLMLKREEIGEHRFSTEKQNEAVSLKDCYFHPDEMYFWDDEFPSPDELINHFVEKNLDWTIMAAVDPSLGKTETRHDYSAIIVILKCRNSDQHYVLDADIRKRKLDQLIKDIYEHVRLRQIHVVGIESNQFQEYFYDRFVLEGRIHAGGFRAKKIVNKVNKETRIYNLQPLIASGKIKFSRKHHLLLQQLREFPKGSHDDGPDALEMAVSLCREKQRMQTGELLAPSHCDHHDWHHVKKLARNRTLKALGYDPVE